MRRTILLFALLLLVSFAGCSQKNDDLQVDNIQETQDFLIAVETGIVETIEAAMQETEAAVPQETATSVDVIVPSTTSTFQPTLAPTQPASAFTPTPTLLPTPCYRAELVEETIPDGTVITVGDGFTKNWVVKNTGVCAWGENFRWILVEGEDFRGDTNVKISNKDVMPGDTISISIEMGSPLIPGHYRSIYKIFTDEGAEVTPNGFWIDVEVVEK